MMALRRFGSLAGVALTFAACAHQDTLVPAPGATLVQGSPHRAEASVAGVHVVVDPMDWRSGAVRTALAPVRVTIEDGSNRALRVSYEDFTLATPSGFRVLPLPPVQVAAENPVVPVDPAFAYRGFWLPPWYARFYRHPFAIWPGPFPYDGPYYDRYYHAWPPTLPDAEIARRALPEGVVDPGGQATGFLYFPDEPKGAAVTFTATLVDARTGQTFGLVRIPLVVA